MLKVEAVDLYYGASQALKKVSLQAGKGQVVSLMGRNGVGKTSMLNAIAGRQAVQQGSINWADKNITHWASFDRARNGIAYVPQGRQIFSQLTVLENLQTGFACLPNRDRFIDPTIYFLFPVLKDMLHRRGGDLSGGQQQQLAIARALVTRPQLLLLDEPTEGIQPSIIKEIQKVITTLRNQGEIAIVLVEQYFEFARDLADHFYVMDRGEIVLSGPAAGMEEDKVRSLMSI